jgi:hypothetical protein
MLCIILLTGVPAQADPVLINQVIQTMSSSNASSRVQLNLVSQDPGLSGTKGSTPNGGPANDSVLALGEGSPKLDSLLSGFTLMSDNQQLGVDIEEGEVEGTVCDCGDILVPGAAFPKWPLLFLTAVPLVFINQCETCDDTPPQSTPTPTPPSVPTPTPPEVPEPASLLLFGTGLLAAGASLRRRYTKAKSQKTEEE